MRLPLIGCALHRVALCMNDWYTSLGTVLPTLDALMHRLSLQAPAAMLRKYTQLVAYIRNETRWTETHLMFLRYLDLAPFLFAHFALGAEGVVILTQQQHAAVVAIVAASTHIYEVVVYLQKRDRTDESDLPPTFADTRGILDDLYSTFPTFERIRAGHAIEHSPAFESGTRKPNLAQSCSPTSTAHIDPPPHVFFCYMMPSSDQNPIQE